MVTIELKSDRSEVIHYNFPDFPVYAREGRLSSYPNMAAASHWHDDFEFIVMLEGTMTYVVNDSSVLLHKGQGIFINARQLHYGYSADGSDGRFLCIILPPGLLCPVKSIYDKYVKPLTKDRNHPSLLLDNAVSWHRPVFDMLQKLYEECMQQGDTFELRFLQLYQALFSTLYQNIKKAASSDTPSDKRLLILHEMIGYIQQNYRSKLSLMDIAQAGNVCRSTCCNIFRDFLHKSPVSYLTSYRLERSLDCLSDSELSITEIALECGFNSSSYYTELFHREMGMTPSDFRQNTLIRKA